MASTEKVSRNKNQNIQVFVRLRPLNQRERGIRSLSVVDVINSKEVVVRQSQQTSHTKKFTFDRAFAPNASQVEVYKEVVSPLIAEVLAGYNCTVFAYGQTGTGKTHTMVGESTTEGTTWQNDPLAGIIPRALSQLFDELRISNTEYTVRVSYLELYNEELCDLLAPDEAAKLRIYEDVTRKGSTIVNGLEEITVYNKNEVYNIMAQGQERKRVASTLMNTQSSRSHTVFTIVVHIKENCPKGEELVKIGKLNLVDLAGSENISKAGSDNPAKKERARECVNINQSLLTLGRVITALVEKHPHIPYRESKLTRILQESLGGRTKTSIIATVSPGHKDLEETMSTLEYAHRAKNIQNKPEVNQKLTKQAILKEYAEEVDKLKRELLAARDKHGVYLPSDMYDEMQIKDDEQRREIQALLLKQRAMEDERARLEAVFAEMEQRRARTERDLHAERGELAHTRSVLSATEQQRAEQEHLVTQLAQTEAQLAQQARQLVDTADVATEHVQCLHDCVDRRQTVECTNHEMVSSYREQATAQREQIIGHANECTDTFMAVREQMQANIDEHAKEGSATHDLNIQDIAQLVAKIASFVNEAKAKSAETEKQLSETAENHAAATECAMRARHETLSGALAQFLATVSAGVQRVEDAALADTVARAAQQWVSEACGRVRCLQTSHSAHASGARALEGRRDAAARQHHAARQARLRARDAALHACLEELEKNNQSLEASLAQQQASMEADRVSTCERLQRLEDTSRALEQQLRQAAADAAEQRAAYDARMTQYHKALQEKRQLLAESMERCLRLRQQLAEASGEESETESARLERCASESAECLRGVQEFEKEFGEGTHAISAEMEAFGHSVVQIVGATSDQLLAGLRDARHEAQQGVETTLSRDLEASEAAAAATRAALSGTVGTATTCLNSVLHAAVEKSESTIETLSAVSDRTVRLAGSLLEHQSGQSGSLEQAAECVERLGCGLRERLGRQAEAEGRYLMQEYRVYEPSGHTPARREFRYPRRLAATSPHERILARFRAQHPRHEDTERGNTRSPDSDCVVLESDEGRNTSDSDVSESSVSEDSAVAMQ